MKRCGQRPWLQGPPTSALPGTHEVFSVLRCAVPRLPIRPPPKQNVDSCEDACGRPRSFPANCTLTDLISVRAVIGARFQPSSTDCYTHTPCSRMCSNRAAQLRMRRWNDCCLLRRGRPTCHKVFGEAIAILAGDALQTQAYEVLASLHCHAQWRVKIIKEVARATGTTDGMIGGQVVDLEAEHTRADATTLEYIHRAKTAALITACVVSGGLYAEANDVTVAKLRSFGQNIGLAFQIVDDILDVT